MPIFSKLSQKQILAIFSGLFALLLISIFVAFQLTNSQRSQAKETQNNLNSQNSSIPNSQKSEQNSSDNSQNNSTSSQSDSNNSLQKSNSTNSSQEVADSSSNSVSNQNSNSQNSTKTTNSNSVSTPNLPNSTNNSESKTTNFNSIFGGKVGNSAIKMIIDKIEQRQIPGQTYSETLIFGSYSYHSQNKPIELRGKYDHGNQLGCIILEEFVNNGKTGEFSTCGNPNRTLLNTDFYENKFSKINGTWTNAKNGEKLNFEVVKEEIGTKKSEDQPIKLSKTCQESEDEWLKSGNDAVASGIAYDPINLGNGEKIVSKVCGGIGAYQGIYNFNYVAASGQKKLLNLPYFDRASKSLKNQTDKCVRSFDWKNGNLTINCSGRGLSDCGSEDIYKWNSTSKELELITAKYQDECILDNPENINKTQKELEELMKNLQFPVVYQK